MKRLTGNKIRIYRHSLICLNIIVFVIIIASCSQEENYDSVSNSYSGDNAKVALFQSELKRKEVQYEELQKQNDTLLSEISNLRKSNKILNQEIDQKKAEIEALEQSNQWRTIGIVLLATLIIGLPLSVIGGMAFRKSPKQTERAVFKECPKCHWELEQATKICPNPECRTRFH